MNESNKFVVIPKETVTITISLKPENNNNLQRLSNQSKRSKNELVNLALRFALERLEIKEDD